MPSHFLVSVGLFVGVTGLAFSAPCCFMPRREKSIPLRILVDASAGREERRVGRAKTPRVRLQQTEAVPELLCPGVGRVSLQQDHQQGQGKEIMGHSSVWLVSCKDNVVRTAYLRAAEFFRVVYTA